MKSWLGIRIAIAQPACLVAVRNFRFLLNILFAFNAGYVTEAEDNETRNSAGSRSRLVRIRDEDDSD